MKYSNVFLAEDSSFGDGYFGYPLTLSTAYGEWQLDTRPGRADILDGGPSAIKLD